jgi:predicted transcriptional regulator
MEVQVIINLIGLIIISVVGFLYKDNTYKLRVLEEKIHKSEVDMPTNYVRKDELSSHLNRIETMLNKIFERLEQKADKP